MRAIRPSASGTETAVDARMREDSGRAAVPWTSLMVQRTVSPHPQEHQFRISFRFDARTSPVEIAASLSGRAAAMIGVDALKFLPGNFAFSNR